MRREGTTTNGEPALFTLERRQVCGDIMGQMTAIIIRLQTRDWQRSTPPINIGYLCAQLSFVVDDTVRERRQDAM